MRRLTILGATGSVGQNTMALIAAAPPDTCGIAALTGGRNIELLARQARAFRPEYVACADATDLRNLRQALEGTGISSGAGASAIAEAAAIDADWTMSAIIGSAGIVPGLAALDQGATLALANKETMVAAGPLARARAMATGAAIIPTDSEHSAVFQLLQGEEPRSLERLIVTASGGPFRTWSSADLARATPEEAARHPNWDMGLRITIDSASMFNKAMEVIEAHELFDIPPEAIEVVVHPQSIIHAVIGLTDGAMLAHLGPSDMKGPIGFALNWPRRADLPLERLDLAGIGRLDFEAPDEARFPALRLARAVMQEGGLAGAAFNAAKEAALDAFLARSIGFSDMARLVEETLAGMASAGSLKTDTFMLDDILGADQEARRRTAAAVAMKHAS